MSSAPRQFSLVMPSINLVFSIMIKYINIFFIFTMTIHGFNNSPDMILFTNCRVYGKPDIKAILCSRGKIVELLPNDESVSGQRVDLKGGWVYPGFTDAHMHLTGMGWALESVDMVGTSTKEEVLEKAQEAVRKAPKGAWIRGRGWDQNDWPEIQYPNAKDLDAISSIHPMIFRRIDGHAAWANSLAMKIAGISKDTKDVDGGIILRDDAGNPAGIFIDNALNLIEAKIPPPKKDDIQRQIKNAQKLLNKLGLTSIHDAGTSKEEIAVMKEMIASGDLSLRIFTMLHNNPDDYELFLETGPETENPFIKVRSVKIYMDGALGSRGAALLEPYSDALDQDGLLIIQPEEHERLVKKFSDRGFQSNTHGIGDRAVKTILNTYEKVANRSLRNRVEHAQIVHHDDLSRFKQLEVIPTMQATHCTSDMYWVNERLGENRLHEAYPWQSFIQMGIPIPGGSDAPVEYPDPLEGIYAAITRQDKKGWPEGGWQPQEKMTLDQAIKSYSEWAAYASFEETVKGKIEPEFYADFTVLNQELKEDNPMDILESQILFTIVGGKIVFQKNDR